MTMPENGFLRLNQILGNPKANPPIPPIIPISRSSWWVGVKKKIYPQPVKLSDKVTVWHVEDILELIRQKKNEPR